MRFARRAALLAICFGLLGLAGLRRAPRLADAHGTSRFAAYVTLTGGDMATALKGATQSELFAYVMDDGEWLGVPIQLDERDAQGNFVATDEGGYDEGDEIVLPVEHAGAKRPAGALPSALTRVAGVVEAKITDPLDASFTSYVYIFRARGGPEQPSAPVSFDTVAKELKSRAYRLGFADPEVDTFVGIKHLSLYSSSRNLLDRLKLRFAVSLGGLPAQVVDEEGLVAFASQIPGLAVKPVKLGPVRAVISATGGFAYADRVDLIGGVPQSLPTGGLGLAVSSARVSLDFSPAAKGALYSDANLKEPVTIDGSPDTVPAGPLPGWRELTFTEGRAILLARVQAGASMSATVYYKDDANTDGNDTGDLQSWGDNGIQSDSLEGLASAGFPGEMVVLPEGRNVSAASLLAQKQSPLAATFSSEALDVGTEPPTAVPTARPTPTFTPAPNRPRIFVPLAVVNASPAR